MWRLADDRWDGRVIGLGAARPLAGSACRRCGGHGGCLYRAANPRAAGRGAGAMVGVVRLADDGTLVPAHAAFLSPVAAVGPSASRHRRSLYPLHRAVRARGVARPRRDVEGTGPGHDGWHVTGPADFASAKGHGDENFPVASRLVRPEVRPAILAFYRFARAADD